MKKSSKPQRETQPGKVKPLNIAELGQVVGGTGIPKRPTGGGDCPD